ncbi:MAG: hypothetical protein ACRDJP_09295 [Actinomycetota bacterium]
MRRGIVAGMVCLLVAACGAPAPRTGRTGAAPGFPPSDEATLIRHFQPVVDAFGLEMTRASLISLDDGYERSATGTHLALYAEPRGVYPVERYLGNMAPLTGALAEVFVRWSKLESFDICQEPVGGTEEAPIPVTRVEVTRTANAAIDWDRTDLAGLLALDLIRYELEDPSGVRVEVFGGAEDHPVYLEAIEEARGIARRVISGA